MLEWFYYTREIVTTLLNTDDKKLIPLFSFA